MGSSNGTAEEPLISFFKSERIEADWSVAIDADPFQLFGPRKGRKVHMPLTEKQLGELLDHIDEMVETQGCEHDLSHTQNWLDLYGLNSPELLIALMAQGGGCDCEIVLNVESENIYLNS